MTLYRSVGKVLGSNPTPPNRPTLDLLYEPVGGEAFEAVMSVRALQASASRHLRGRLRLACKRLE